MKLIFKTLSLVGLLAGEGLAHDAFETELDVAVGQQTDSPTGDMIADYGVAYEQNLPIYMTTDLLFNEIIDTSRQAMHAKSWFAEKNDGQMPNWFLMFSMPKCKHCVEIKPDLIELASFYHDPKNADLNYRVAEIDCMEPAAQDLCVYFQINKLPKLMVLRADTDMFYLYPVRDPRTFTSWNHFAMSTYE